MTPRLEKTSRNSLKKRNALHSSQPQSSRSGIITFWAIVSIPIILILLCVILEIGNLWLARIQFKNALESGALAAVKEWGDGGGGDTTLARETGNNFAALCMINGTPVELDTIDATLNDTSPNSTVTGTSNADCNGVFVFGSLVCNNPDFQFDPCNAYGCAVPANVLVDASGFATLAGAANNDWGISVQPTNTTPPGTYVTRVVIRLPDNFGPNDPVFDFRLLQPTVSSNTSSSDVTNKVRCFFNDLACSSDDRTQADVLGISPGDVSFSVLSTAQFGDDGAGGRLESSATGIAPAGQRGKVLAIDFCGSQPCDSKTCTQSPFEPGDRIRFGALVNNNTNGFPLFDGDAIGNMGAEVTVFFNNGAYITGSFNNNTNSQSIGQRACSNVSFAPWGSCAAATRSGMTFAGYLPDQPPRLNVGGNNGQSIAHLQQTSGVGGYGLAVRAQATYEVPSLCNMLFGVPIGPFHVTAKADATYQCSTGRLRIYHLDDENLNCANPLACP
ncbi:pilus assembly protein TadG-related protein [Thalassoglobus polymorphus]|uniref:Putative Flp pilus-assembly TadG-like N-terminal domain-containing protein n=1 Tax=Thalassoglobus polymorphus TaxID=2527994 RepID=A0A517QKT4_9PLAN|nr:pilus assembly protein TadG-related protein [Thalassoglobus polymorphus]QDT32147.1 hypothetical protein Mal48_13890 [Thalassoglobus polymorphus]